MAEIELLNDSKSSSKSSGYDYDTLVNETMSGSLEAFLEALHKGLEEEFGQTVERQLLESEKAYRLALGKHETEARQKERKYKMKAAEELVKYELTLRDKLSKEQRQKKLKELEEEFKKREELETAAEKKRQERLKQSQGARPFNPLD